MIEWVDLLEVVAGGANAQNASLDHEGLVLPFEPALARQLPPPGGLVVGGNDN